MSVFRFYRWLLVLDSSGTITHWMEHQFPPIDVLMVWHSYLLNPRCVVISSGIPTKFDRLISWYMEDCERLPLLRSLKGINDLLLTALVSISQLFIIFEKF